MSYTAPDIEIYKMEPCNGFLKGSITAKPIKINSVTVEEYEDGFAPDGGFKDISFD